MLGSVKRVGGAGGAPTGAVIDGSGRLYHIRHRVYDPSLGRWLTRDPAGFVDGMNLYEYCAGQSIDAMDPSGPASRQLEDDLDRQLRRGRIDRGNGSGLRGTWTEREERCNQQIADRLDREAQPLIAFWTTAAKLLGSLIRGVGELMDLDTISDPNSSALERVVAFGSMAISVVTLGMSPNSGTAAGALAKTEDRAGSVLRIMVTGGKDLQRARFIRGVERGEKISSMG